MSYPRASRSGLLALCLIVVCANTTHACNVPVFRYALEKWKASPYEIHLFYRGSLSPSQESYAHKLETTKTINCTLTRINLDATLTKEQETLWRLRGDKASLPFVVLQYPGDDAQATPLWTGPLDETKLASVFDSPMRQQIIKLLTRGESAVWLLLESGDKSADDEAARLATVELARLKITMKLPVQEEADKLVSSLPLRLSFALVRLSREEAKEALFLSMLLGSDEELAKVKGPILFPIFGRGRLLIGLHGTQLKATSLERWATFLCGPCSCQVKDLNPGMDLLLSAAWNELLEADDAPEPTRPALTAPEIPPGRTTTPSPPLTEPRGTLQWWLLPALGICTIVVLVAGLRVFRRS